jgi:maltooligosyltrehalose trehalohydrolase
MDRSRFVCFAQNHDQIGNRATGERLAHLVSPERAEIAAALLLTAPFVPMLFQGEEWAASAPFLYFTDIDDEEVGRAVREGRRAEFAAFGWEPEDVPNPQDPETWNRSRLDWSERDEPDHARLVRWHQQLIALRAEYPSLRDGRVPHTVVRHEPGSTTIVVERSELSVAVNLGEAPEAIEVRPIAAVLLSNDRSVAIGDGQAQESILLAPDTVAILTH